MKKHPVRHQTQNEIDAREGKIQTDMKTFNNSIGSLSNIEDGDTAGKDNVLDGVEEESHPTDHILNHGLVR